MIDLGDTLALTWTTASTAATLTIGLPDGTTTSPAATGPSGAVFRASYVPTQAGRHTVQWVGSSPADAKSDVINVAPVSPGPIIGLDEAKTHLKLTGTTFDEELRGFLDAATPVVEDVVGPVVVRTYTEVHRRPGSLLVLGYRPVVSLTSLAPVLTNGTIYQVADLDLDPETGIVRRLDGCRFRGPQRATYKAGRMVVPANITQGCKEIIRHMWETQRGHSGARPGLGDEELVMTGSGYTIPRRALELLGPHRRDPLIA